MKKLLRKIGFVASSFIASVGAATAAVPAGVSTALGDLETDVTSVGTLAFMAFLAIVVFAYFRKAAH